MHQKAIIIGAGIGGIATAIRLAVKGIQVQVFEANDYPGGKLTSFEQGGFRFDAGPSLFTMPQYVEELFRICQKPIGDYFSYQALDILCNYFYEDGTQFSAYSDIYQFAQELALHTEATPQQILQHLAKSKEIYDITHHVFLEQSLHKLGTFLSKETMISFLKLGRIGLNQNMHQANAKAFQDERLVQLFDRYATYNGSNPYEAPSTLNVIPHLEHGFGAFFPKGGMHSITLALYRLALDMGVVFHFQQRVEKIIVEEQIAKGIRTQNEKHTADIIVSNMDVYPSYHRLLKGQERPERVLNQTRSSSALIFYWGILKEFPELDLHNIFFSKDYQREFEAIFKHNTIHFDPTIYVNISSKLNPADAPATCENWFVMINVPNNTGQDWDQLIKDARTNILSKLNRLLKTNISHLVLSESILDPRTIESRTSSYQGSLYGSSSNNKLAAFLRHPNFSQKIKNLYFCGGSVHPGGGIPLCLLSAKIVSEIIEN